MRTAITARFTKLMSYQLKAAVESVLLKEGPCRKSARKLFAPTYKTKETGAVTQPGVEPQNQLQTISDMGDRTGLFLWSTGKKFSAFSTQP